MPPRPSNSHLFGRRLPPRTLSSRYIHRFNWHGRHNTEGGLITLPSYNHHRGTGYPFLDAYIAYEGFAPLTYTGQSLGTLRLQLQAQPRADYFVSDRRIRYVPPKSIQCHVIVTRLLQFAELDCLRYIFRIGSAVVHRTGERSRTASSFSCWSRNDAQLADVDDGY